MQTVILAAGAGTRMRPLTDRRPKPALPVGEQPLVAHTADAAVTAGASRLVVVVGYEADAVRAALGDEHRGVPVTYVEQSDQRGTAHAVRVAREVLERAPFAVLNGDDIYDGASLRAVFDDAPAVGAYRVENPSAYGVFETTDGVLDRVTEKPADPPSELINVGAYAFPASALDRLDVDPSERGEEELTDVLGAVARETAVAVRELAHWQGVGRPWELLTATDWALAGGERSVAGDVASDADLRGPVVVREGATVEPGVVIEGPTLVQSGAHVGPNAYVRPTTVVGRDAEVGHAVEIKNSVLMDGAAVPHQSYVGDSVLGRDVNLGAGTQVANLRHDEEPVRFRVNGERVSTGRRKFGVVLGDGAKTGIGTTLNAGVCLGTEARTGPGETVTRDRGRAFDTE